MSSHKVRPKHVNVKHCQHDVDTMSWSCRRCGRRFEMTERQKLAFVIEQARQTDTAAFTVLRDQTRVVYPFGASRQVN